MEREGQWQHGEKAEGDVVTEMDSLAGINKADWCAGWPRRRAVMGARNWNGIYMISHKR